MPEEPNIRIKGIKMFIVIPKSVIDECPEESLPAWICSGKYILAKSKEQAVNAIGQAECEALNYKIYELK